MFASSPRERLPMRSVRILTSEQPCEVQLELGAPRREPEPAMAVVRRATLLVAQCVSALRSR